MFKYVENVTFHTKGPKKEAGQMIFLRSTQMAGENNTILEARIHIHVLLYSEVWHKISSQSEENQDDIILICSCPESLK